VFRIRLRLQSWTVNCFSALPSHAIRRPWRVLFIVALVTLTSAAGGWRLKLRTDGHALLARSTPEVLYDETIREQFGIKDNIVVLIRSSHPDGIFNPATLQLVRDLSAEFQKIPGLAPADVMSLATEKGFRVGLGTRTFETLLEPAPTNKAALDQLRDDLRRIELYTGTLVSSDGKSTVILVGMPDGATRSQIYEQVLQIIAAKQGARDEIGVTGAPVAESLLGIQILEDLGVPRALLGVSAQSGMGGPEEWKLPASLHKLRLMVARRVGLVPLAALVMMLILLPCFHNLLAALLPLPGVVAAVLFVFGLMGWLGVPVYLTTAVMPVVLTVISVTNDIYLCNRYFSLLREKPRVNHVTLIEETFEGLVRPVACTSLTAVIGFLSFGFSPLAPVRAFGVFTGVGALFGLLFSLTAVPAMLVLINPAWLLSRRRREWKDAASPLAAGFARLGRVVVRQRGWVVGLALFVTVLTLPGLRRLVVQDSWINGFDPESEFRRVTQQVNDDFFGMHQLFATFNASKVITGGVAASNVGPGAIIFSGNLVDDPVLITGSSITLSIPEESPTNSPDNRPHAVWQSHVEAASRSDDRIFARIARTDPPGRFWDELRKAGQARFEVVVRTHTSPDIIRAIADLASFIREKRQYAVGGVISPADYLSTTRFMVRPGDPAARQLPDNAAEIKLLWDYYGLALGPQRLRRVVDTNYWQSLTTVFLRDANFVDTAKLMGDIRDYEREHLTPKGIKIGFAGDVAVSQSLIRGIVSTQLQSLIWSLAGIFLVTAFFGGSWRWGLYCLLPSLLAVVIKFAVMGLAGIPLGVATSMFAAMTLGIGVNCAIHLLEGCRQARATGASPAEALNRSFGLTGPPALINTLAMSFGFGVLVLSQVPANARLGILLVLGLVNCFVASLLLLPALLHWLPLNNLDGTRLPNCHKLQE
jgi:predicted RND superfamily exporter protein